jgi:hypothetical protein
MEDRTLLTTFLVTTAADSGSGTLRQAILDSNAEMSAPNTIDFAIPGAGVQTIAPISELPAITASVLIDGSSQPGYAGTPLIELNGSQAGVADGLTITGPNVMVRGLDVNGYSHGAGILISGATATVDVITANTIGRDPTGTLARPNCFGVRILGGAHDNAIGGTSAALGNLIASNTGPGVSVEGDGTVGNRITANRIFANGVPPTPTPAGMLQFDGSSYVRLPANLILPYFLPGREDLGSWSATSFAGTVEAWFQTTSGGVVLGYQNTDPSANPTSGSPLLYVGSDGRLYSSDSLLRGSDYQELSPIVSDTAVNDGRWHHVALVIGVQGRTLFVDGRMAGAGSGVFAFAGAGYTFYNQIGTGYTNPSDPATPGGLYGFRGQIDEVRVWTLARSDDQIRQDMMTALTGTEPGLDASYAFDEGHGPTAHDQTSNLFDGTLGGTRSELPVWSSSSGVAIDLRGDGTTVNSTSRRLGPNNLQHFPIVVTTAGGHLEGWLGGSAANTSYHLEFFAGDGYSPSGTGQAEIYLGSLQVTTDDHGEVIFNVPYTAPATSPTVTATATDSRGNTSEVSSDRVPRLEAPTRALRLVPGRPLVFSAAAGHRIALYDSDAGPLDPAWDLHLSVAAGALKLSSTDGLVGSGDGTGKLHYRGPLSALNAALERLSFTPPPGFHGNTAMSLDAVSAGATPLQANLLITDGTFLVTTTADSGPGSLRQGILDSNAATGGPNAIDFAIPGPGVQTIALESALPAITNPVLIDGFSQPGYGSTSWIAINTSSSGLADGLIITGSDATVRGLAIDGFALGAENLPGKLTLQSGPLWTVDSGNSGRVDTYRIHTISDGRLFVQIRSLGVMTRVSLLDAQGRALVESDHVSAAREDGQIDQHLAVGTYFIKIVTRGGAGDWNLTATLTPSSAPFQPISVVVSNGGHPYLAVGDFNGDGILDLATADGTHLGAGDGTFREPSVGLGFSAGNPDLIGMVSGDFDGDGTLDLVVESWGGGSIAVLLDNGDGSFHPPMFYAVGAASTYPDGNNLIAGDFNDDGHLDLAVANIDDNDISVLLGNGDGTFQPDVECAAGQGPVALVAGDFNGDGHLDLATANSGSDDVSLLVGDGDGTFQPAVEYAVGEHPDGLVAADFNGDGRLDFAVADGGSGIIAGAVSMLLGNGGGTFQPAKTYAVGERALGLLTGDFNGDGRPDLAATIGYRVISVMLSNGDGTFQAPREYAAGSSPSISVAGDFNGDGGLDLAIGNFDSTASAFSVLLGHGDGTFPEPQRAAVGSGRSAPVSGAVADFNGDGREDLATANWFTPDISVLLGNGDGTFEPQRRFAAGQYPASLVAGDFNGDGRLDLATGNLGSNDISVLLGNGDGTFQPQVTYAAGNYPSALVAGDFNGDAKVDLAVAAADYDNEAGLYVLLGNGDGRFQPAKFHAVGSSLDALAAEDFNRDGKLDLVVVDEGNNFSEGTAGVYVLLGNGDGTFQAPKFTAAPEVAGVWPYSLVAADFNEDGWLDLAMPNSFNASFGISVLLGNGDGTFQAPKQYATEYTPRVLVTADFNADGRLDFAYTAVGFHVDSTAELLGNGDGTFQPPEKVAPGSQFWLVAGDFNGDGRNDLAYLRVDLSLSSDKLFTVLLGDGDGTFSDPSQLAATPHAKPVVADANGDGTNDVLVVDGSGNLLYRQGIPGQPGAFQPPITINPGLPARDIAWVPKTDQGPVLASVDARDDAVSLFAWRHGGFVRVEFLATGRLPAQIVAGDLDADGRTDLVVRNAGDGTLSLYRSIDSSKTRFMGPLGDLSLLPSFLPPVTLSVGLGVSDVGLVDTTGRDVLDIVVTNKLTGQLSILLNRGDGTVLPPEPYRAGTGLSGLDASSGSPHVTSLEATAGVAAGMFTNSVHADLVTINPGSNTLGLLAGLGESRFANPLAIQTPDPVQVVRVADFDHDGTPDLALLTSNGLSVLLGDGKRGFGLPVAYDVPGESSGLTIADANGDGKPDLLVGDAYGDVLELFNKGDGTFRPYHEADRSVTLAVADLTGTGSNDIIYADQGLDRVVVDYGAGQSAVLGSRSTGLLGPGAVKLADLNGDSILDLVVANSGSNNILIYPGLGGGQFGPAVNGGHGYFVGTDPVGITVANVTGSLPDLVVADKGSNQVSILLNQGNFRFTAGPRLNSGGSGPTSTVVGHFSGGPYPDILVSNSQSNNVVLLPGVGGGFFNDTSPRSFAVGNNPGPLFVGNFDGKPDLVTVNAGSNDLTLISNFTGSDPLTITIPSGGLDPVSAFAFSSTSGFDDLVVANNGDGALALFEGSAAGLTMSSSEIMPELPSPTALAFAALSGGQIQFYAATEGREAAVLVELTLTGESGLPSSAGALSPSIPENVAQLVPVSESSLALVGSLLIVTLETPASELSVSSAEIAAATGTGALAAGPGAVGQSLVGHGGSGLGEGTGDLEFDQAEQPSAAIAPAKTMSWERFVLGIDEALERYDREHREKPPSALTPGRESSPAPKQHEAGTAAPADSPVTDRILPDKGQRGEALDQAIELLFRDPRQGDESIPMDAGWYVEDPFRLTSTDGIEVSKSSSAIAGPRVSLRSPSGAGPQLGLNGASASREQESPLGALILGAVAAAWAHDGLRRRPSQVRLSQPKPQNPDFRRSSLSA